MHNGLAHATNDIGLIELPDGRRLAIAVFVTDSMADEATRERVIAEIGRAAYDAARKSSATSTKVATRLLAEASRTAFDEWGVIR